MARQLGDGRQIVVRLAPPQDSRVLGAQSVRGRQDRQYLRHNRQALKTL